MYTKRAELKAGLVVLSGVVALLAFLYVAGGSEPIWGNYRYVHLRFEPGFIAPKVGDDVLMNGNKIGRVSEIRQGAEFYRGGALTAAVRARLEIRDPGVSEARELFILAVCKLPKDQVLPRGTTAIIDANITGTRKLSLLPGWSPENLTDEDIRRAPLAGRQAPGLAEITSRLDEIAGKVGVLVDGGTELITDARRVIAVLKQKVEGFDLEGLNADARAGIGSLRRTLETLEKRFGPIADKVESAAGNLDRMTSMGAETVASVKADLAEILSTLKGVAGRVDQILVDAEPKISAFLSDMDVVGKNIVKLSEELQGIGPDVRDILSDLDVDADELMKTLKDTGYNLLDASEDLRAHPWKLLNEPSGDKIAFENLRNATLNYERAMRELNGASRRLTQLLMNPPASAERAKLAITKALESFEARLAGARGTERRFLMLLNQQRQAAGGGRK